MCAVQFVCLKKAVEDREKDESVEKQPLSFARSKDVFLFLSLANGQIDSYYCILSFRFNKCWAVAHAAQILII